ncbi:hypothetical protein ACFL6I_18445 [candidate division KSB1 bacterium]
MDGEIKERMGIGFEEFLLVILIIAGVTEFAGFLPADLDYIKKIISWVCLGYLMYKVNLTEIIFGYKDKFIDTMLILAYFMFVVKNFIEYSNVAIEEVAASGSSLLIPFYSFILDNAFKFEMITFYIGGGLLILLAILNLILNVEIKEPSIMAIIHKEGPPENVLQRMFRALSSFLIYCAFFVVVFNLIMEWLAWAVDSTLVVVAIFFYFFFFIKRFRRLDTQSYLYKVGESTDEFYEKFINLFHSRNTLVLGVSGLLVLHLLTDTGNFILPYIIGKKINYFIALGAGHTVIPYLLSIDIGLAATPLLKISVILIYVLNIAAMLFLFIGPAFIWYQMYQKRKMELPNIVCGLFFASFFAFMALPIFKIKRMVSEGIYGVDILTRNIIIADSLVVAGIALAILLLVSLLCYSHIIKSIFRYISISLVEVFFAYYIYLYFSDIAGFYVKAFALIKNEFILFYLSIFLFVTICFYFGGIIYFIYHTIIDITKKFI